MQSYAQSRSIYFLHAFPKSIWLYLTSKKNIFFLTVFRSGRDKNSVTFGSSIAERNDRTAGGCHFCFLPWGSQPLLTLSQIPTCSPCPDKESSQMDHCRMPLHLLYHLCSKGPQSGLTESSTCLRVGGRIKITAVVIVSQLILTFRILRAIRNKKWCHASTQLFLCCTTFMHSKQPAGRWMPCGCLCITAAVCFICASLENKVAFFEVFFLPATWMDSILWAQWLIADVMTVTHQAHWWENGWLFFFYGYAMESGGA